MSIARSFDPPGRMVEVRGTPLHLHPSGSGTPTVVLEAGIAATSLSWALVQAEIARRTTVVSYDRAGLGWSGPCVTARTPSVIAAELQEALHVAGLPGPYILVGHSFGGLVVQRFAALYPGDVLGAVLVDALAASEFCPMTAAKSRMLSRGIRLSRRGALLARWGVVGASLRILLAGNQLVPKLAARLTSGSGGAGLTDRLAGEIRKLPRNLWPAIAWHWSQAKNFEGLARHLECLPESATEMSTSRMDAAVPVIAIVAENSGSAGFPAHWTVIRAHGSGHWIQLDRPDLVVAAVAELCRAGFNLRTSDLP